MKHRKIKINRDILIVAILALILVVTWIVVAVFNVYHQPIDAELKKIARPINPKLDEQIFSNLNQRLQVDFVALPDQIIIPQDTTSVPDNQSATNTSSLTPVSASETAPNDNNQPPLPTDTPVVSVTPTLAP